VGFFSIGMVKNYPSSTRPHKFHGMSDWASKAVWVSVEKPSGRYQLIRQLENRNKIKETNEMVRNKNGTKMVHFPSTLRQQYPSNGTFEL
jgi:hypothetical protein